MGLTYWGSHPLGKFLACEKKRMKNRTKFSFSAFEPMKLLDFTWRRLASRSEKLGLIFVMLYQGVKDVDISSIYLAATGSA